MSTLFQDLRFGFRMLLKNPGFTVVAMLTLALGIGANSTIFSWINATLLTPIPGVRNTQDIVAFVRGESNDNASPPSSYPDYLDLRNNCRSFTSILAYHDDWMAFTGAAQPERVYGVMASANYFDLLGVRPILGRGFLPDEETRPGGAPVVVLSYGLWQARFAGNRAVLGKTIEINRHLFTIIGVAPPLFQGCKTGLRAEIWVPLAMAESITGWNQLAPRDNFWFNLSGRLKSGVSRRQAQEEINVLMRQIAAQFPKEHRTSSAVTLEPLWRSSIGATGILHVFLPTLLAIAGVVLLLACVNVANLLLVRSVGRRREMAIRLSMGASRWRLVRQLMIESLLLSLAGGLSALLVTTWTAASFGYFLPAVSLPLAIDVQVDRSVVLATIVLSMATGVIFGILPALRASRLSPALVMKEEAGSVSAGSHRSRVSNLLVVAQIVLSMLLLICAGLFVRSLQNSQRLNPGFDPDHVLLTTFDLLPAGYSEAKGLEFDKQLLSRLEALPGVEAVTLADSVPLCFNNHSSIIAPDGYVPQLHESMEVGRAYVGPNYLRTMRIPLVSGRDLTLRDSESSQPVALVNQALAERYWPGQEAIGRQIRVEGISWTVVGVAKNSLWANLDNIPRPLLFIPLFQDYYHEAILHVRVLGDPQTFASAVANTVHELDPGLPLYDVASLRARTHVASFLGRIAVAMVGAFGLVALVLAAIGIYGVISNSTRQRTHEIGIRVAIGAGPGTILRQVIGHGLRLAIIGLVLGTVLSMILTRSLRSQLVGIAATDALTYSSVAVILCIVALVASFVPARRASRIDPTEALRYE